MDAKEEFERNGYRYTPEESVTLSKAKGRIWSRWEIQRGSGSGQAFDGRVFVPEEEKSQAEVVARFNED